MAKFCSGCGAKLEDAAKFCAFCGAPCAAPQQPTQPQAPQPQAYAPQQQLTQKQYALQNAPLALNRPDQPWYVTAEGDALVARWKWTDGTFFTLDQVTNETRTFTFTVTLSDNGTWRELDNSAQKKAGVSMSGGKLSIGGSSSTFSGKQNQKSFSLGVKPDAQGQLGLAASKFDTTLVKQPIRDYLTACGWKKAGLFG
ncbi:MAG: zinc ribbon domain-containing protein [Oscillospiraceae bacterium]|nr:zinc ribbon domain-containing protein [Oscillospiraceae bacterium]